MRGRIWALFVGSIFAGLLLRALSTAQPSNPAESTSDVAGILSVTEPVAGLLIMLLAVGAVVSLAMPSSGGL